MEPTGVLEGWQMYEGHVMPTVGGTFGYAVRILPWHQALAATPPLDLLHWATARPVDAPHREKSRV